MWKDVANAAALTSYTTLMARHTAVELPRPMALLYVIVRPILHEFEGSECIKHTCMGTRTISWLVAETHEREPSLFWHGRSFVTLLYYML